jgi:elongation factor G
VYKNIFVNSGPQLMEPVNDVEIYCSSDVMGDIMGDLQTRRAIIQGMGQEGRYQKIMAKVPEAEMYQYGSTLRSLSQGRAKFTNKFAEFHPVPHDIQRKLISAYQTELEEA